jgi:hypothetical protein
MAAEYYQIKSNLPIKGEHWGLEFTAGVARTNDGTLAGKLMRKGYAVTCVAESEEAPKDPVDAKKPEGITTDLSVKELREIGKQHGLTFAVGTTKKDMAAAINEINDQDDEPVDDEEKD